MAKLYTPKRSAAAKVKTAKMSSHLVKPARFASSKVSVKAPRYAARGSKLSKVKV